MERKEPMLAPRLGANIGSSFAGDWNQERRRKPSRYFIECFRSRPYRQCIGGSHTIYCTGSSTAMVVPLSELFSTQTEPPWRSEAGPHRSPSRILPACRAGRTPPCRAPGRTQTARRVLQTTSHRSGSAPDWSSTWRRRSPPRSYCSQTATSAHAASR